MDAADAPGPVAAAAPSAAFPIAVVIAIGFMVTSLILVSYYLLVVRCWLRARGAPGSGLHPRSRGEELAEERVPAVFFASYEAEPPRGVEPYVVAALPVVKYGRARSRSRSAAALECAVCLSEFVPGERLKMLPACSHAFHIDCIDTWLHHNVSCPLCRTAVTGPVGPAAAAACDDDRDASGRDFAGERRIDVAAARTGHGSSCRFPKQERSGAAQEPIRRSFSMDFLPGDRRRKPRNEPGSEAAPPSHPGGAGSSSTTTTTTNVGGETSGRFRRILSSFRHGRSSRTTVLPIHIDP